MAERLELELDPPTASWLRGQAERAGGSMSAAALAKLRDLALRDAVDAVARWHDAHPDYLDHMVEETERALAELS